MRKHRLFKTRTWIILVLGAYLLGHFDGISTYEVQYKLMGLVSTLI